MEKRTITYNVYKYEELGKDIQEKLLEEEKETQKEFYIDTLLYENMQEEAQRLLTKYFGNKATLKDVYYSLAYCQGDGAMIEFDLYYYNKYVKIRHSGFYYHSRCFSIDTFELTEKQEEQLKQKIIAMNEELEATGLELMEEEPDNDFCIEQLKEHTYLQNGEVFEY